MQALINKMRQLSVNTELDSKTVFAIRGTDNDVKIGDVLSPSYEWVDNEKTNNRLSGTCACKLADVNQLEDLEDAELLNLIAKTIKIAQAYGNKLVLVCGIDSGEAVNDYFANEVIINDCTVIGVVC